MIKYLIVTGGILFLALGCKKETYPVTLPETINLAKLIAGDTAKTWIDFYRGGIRGDGSTYVINNPCFTDDNWIFKANGYFEMNEGGSKCSVGDPYTFAVGVWKLSEDKQFIEISNITGDPGIQPDFRMQIIEITSEKLSLRTSSMDLYVNTTGLEQDDVLIAK